MKVLFHAVELTHSGFAHKSATIPDPPLPYPPKGHPSDKIVSRTSLLKHLESVQLHVIF